MLPEFSTKPKESPWHPKLCKNKPKLRRIQFSKSYGDNVCVYGRVFDVGEFKCANKNFRGAKGVAIATIFTQKGQKCTDFTSVRNTVPISTYMIGVSGLQNSNMSSEFFREQRELLLQPNRRKQAKIVQILLLYKIMRIFSREQ